MVASRFIGCVYIVVEFDVNKLLRLLNLVDFVTALWNIIIIIIFINFKTQFY